MRISEEAIQQFLEQIESSDMRASLVNAFFLKCLKHMDDLTEALSRSEPLRTMFAGWLKTPSTDGKYPLEILYEKTAPKDVAHFTAAADLASKHIDLDAPLSNDGKTMSELLQAAMLSYLDATIQWVTTPKKKNLNTMLNTADGTPVEQAPQKGLKKT